MNSSQLRTFAKRKRTIKSLCRLIAFCWKKFSRHLRWDCLLGWWMSCPRKEHPAGRPWQGRPSQGWTLWEVLSLCFCACCADPRGSQGRVLQKKTNRVSPRANKGQRGSWDCCAGPRGGRGRDGLRNTNRVRIRLHLSVTADTASFVTKK